MNRRGKLFQLAAIFPQSTLDNLCAYRIVMSVTPSVDKASNTMQTLDVAEGTVGTEGRGRTSNALHMSQISDDNIFRRWLLNEAAYSCDSPPRLQQSARRALAMEEIIIKQ